MAVITTLCNGYNYSVGLSPEVTEGTAVDPALFLPWGTLSFNESLNLVGREVARKSRGRQVSTPGSRTYDVSFDFICDPDNMTEPAYYAMGAIAEGSYGDGAYYHQVSLGTTLPSITAEIDQENTCEQFAGCKIDSAKWSCEMEGNLMCSLGTKVISRAEHAVTAASYGTKNPFTFIDLSANTNASGYIKVGGTQNYYFTRFEINLANAVAEARALSGGINPVGLKNGRAAVTGSFTLLFASKQARELFWGGIGETTPMVTPAATSLEFYLTSNNVIGSSSYYYSAVFSLGNVFLTRNSVSPNNNAGPTEESYDFEAFETTPGGMDDLVITVVNETDQYITP